MSNNRELRIVMAKELAARWLAENSHPEYRLTVYHMARDMRGIPALLRAFRDGKVRLGSVAPVRDLGIREAFDSFTIWSKEREALIELQSWFEDRGFETSGIW